MVTWQMRWSCWSVISRVSPKRSSGCARGSRYDFASISVCYNPTLTYRVISSYAKSAPRLLTCSVSNLICWDALCSQMSTWISDFAHPASSYPVVLQRLDANMLHMQSAMEQNARATKSMFHFMEQALHNPAFLQQILNGQNNRVGHSNEFLMNGFAGTELTPPTPLPLLLNELITSLLAWLHG